MCVDSAKILSYLANLVGGEREGSGTGDWPSLYSSLEVGAVASCRDGIPWTPLWTRAGAREAV